MEGDNFGLQASLSWGWCWVYVGSSPQSVSSPTIRTTPARAAVPRQAPASRAVIVPSNGPAAAHSAPEQSQNSLSVIQVTKCSGTP